MPRQTTAESQPIELPDWGGFQLAMLQNGGYQKVSGATTSQRAVSRLETFFATEVDNWPVAVMLWQLMIGGCPEVSKPLPEEVAGWNAISQQNHMLIQFNEQGLLEAVNEDG